MDKVVRLVLSAASTASSCAARKCTAKASGRIMGLRVFAVMIYLSLLGRDLFSLPDRSPPGFVPTQDKQYLISFTQLPYGATLDRTEAVIRQMSEIALKQPGVRKRGRLPRPLRQRLHQQLELGHCLRHAQAVRGTQGLLTLSGPGHYAGDLQQKFGAIKDGFVIVVPAPPVNGLGTTAGFKLQVEDRTDLGYEALDAAMQKSRERRRDRRPSSIRFPSIPSTTSPCRSSTSTSTAPRRSSSASMCRASSIRCRFDLGSLYINDFNKFGRTYQVIAQADKQFRSKPDDILNLRTRNAAGADGAARGDGQHQRHERPGQHLALQRIPLCGSQRRPCTRLLQRPGPGRHCQNSA